MTSKARTRKGASSKNAPQYVPTLSGLPEKIQLMIVAHLVVSQTSIQLDPCAPPPTGIPAGNMNIAQISKHFHELALRAFYSLNHFVLLPNEQADLPGPIHPKWVQLALIVPKPLTPESSLDCLSLVAQLPGCRTHLRTLSTHLGACGITCFYQDFFTSLLSHLPLRTLEFVLVPGWARILDRRFGNGFMSPGEKPTLYPNFPRGFMLVVHERFPTVQSVLVRKTVEPNQRARRRRGGGEYVSREDSVVKSLSVALEARNRAWLERNIESGEGRA